MNKPNSFIYINLNSVIGKYTMGALIVGNIVIGKAIYKGINKIINKKIKMIKTVVNWPT